MEKPLVSVIMATFNEPPGFIAAAVNSILTQSIDDLELLIADDSTAPATIGEIDRLAADPRVVVIRTAQRMGFVPALNEGLRRARGTYLARMDGDDMAAPGRIAAQLRYFEQFPEVDIIGGAMNIIDQHGTVIARRDYPAGGIKMLLWTMFRSPLGHPTVMFRRTIVDAGFFYDESFKKAEDLEFWLRLRKHGFRIANLPEVLLNYRVVGDLAEKRTKENFRYNARARTKNISAKHLLTDLPAIVIARLYSLTPRKLVSRVYAIENK